MKIAIIGSGISGNTIAHLLYKDHDIQVFENDSRIGGHSHTHNISVEENKEITVDTGFIVFNKKTSLINSIRRLAGSGYYFPVPTIKIKLCYY